MIPPEPVVPDVSSPYLDLPPPPPDSPSSWPMPNAMISSTPKSTTTLPHPGPHKQPYLFHHHHHHHPHRNMAVGLGVHLVGGGASNGAGGGGTSVNGAGGVNPCYVLEDYMWVDRDGRPTSPPHGEPRGKNDYVRKVGKSRGHREDCLKSLLVLRSFHKTCFLSSSVTATLNHLAMRNRSKTKTHTQKLGITK